MVMQKLIEAEAVERIGAGRYERTPERLTERKGTRPRLVTTQAAGDVGLRIPKLREGRCSERESWNDDWRRGRWTGCHRPFLP